jgi:hypothetical protein
MEGLSMKSYNMTMRNKCNLKKAQSQRIEFWNFMTLQALVFWQLEETKICWNQSHKGTVSA